MEYKLKPISQAGINEAISKVELYRYLNEPGEAESICRDILTLDPEHQTALRLLGLSITDQFTGGASDRYAEADRLFRSLTNEYERAYYGGIISERFARRKLRDGHPGAKAVAYGHLHEAMAAYEKAEKLAPSGNDDAVLRFNACVRMIERHGLTPPPADEREPLLE